MLWLTPYHFLKFSSEKRSDEEYKISQVYYIFICDRKCIINLLHIHITDIIINYSALCLKILQKYVPVKVARIHGRMLM